MYFSRNQFNSVHILFTFHVTLTISSENPSRPSQSSSDTLTTYLLPNVQYSYSLQYHIPTRWVPECFTTKKKNNNNQNEWVIIYNIKEWIINFILKENLYGPLRTSGKILVADVGPSSHRSSDTKGSLILDHYPNLDLGKKGEIIHEKDIQPYFNWYSEKKVRISKKKKNSEDRK